LVYFVCRYLTDQLQKVQIVNNVNKVSNLVIINHEFIFLSVFFFFTLLEPDCVLLLKNFVIETLRSISELITYGDQHDSNYFE
jgi:protein CLEC16A